MSERLTADAWKRRAIEAEQTVQMLRQDNARLSARIATMTHYLYELNRDMLYHLQRLAPSLREAGLDGSR